MDAAPEDLSTPRTFSAWRPWRGAVLPALVLALAGAWVFGLGRPEVLGALRPLLAPYGPHVERAGVGTFVVAVLAPGLVGLWLAWRLLARSQAVIATDEWLRMGVGAQGQAVSFSMFPILDVADRRVAPGGVSVSLGGLVRFVLPASSPEEVEALLVRIDAGQRARAEPDGPWVPRANTSRRVILLAAVGWLVLGLAVMVIAGLVDLRQGHGLGGALLGLALLGACLGFPAHLAQLETWTGRVQVGRRWLVVGPLTLRFADVEAVGVSGGFLAAQGAGARAWVRIGRGREAEALARVRARLAEAGNDQGRATATLPSWARRAGHARQTARSAGPLAAAVLLVGGFAAVAPDVEVVAVRDPAGQTLHVVLGRGDRASRVLVVDSRGDADVLVITGGAWRREWRTGAVDATPAVTVDLERGVVLARGEPSAAIPVGTAFVHVGRTGVSFAPATWLAGVIDVVPSDRALPVGPVTVALQDTGDVGTWVELLGGLRRDAAPPVVDVVLGRTVRRRAMALTSNGGLLAAIDHGVVVRLAVLSSFPASGIDLGWSTALRSDPTLGSDAQPFVVVAADGTARCARPCDLPKADQVNMAFDLLKRGVSLDAATAPLLAPVPGWQPVR